MAGRTVLTQAEHQFINAQRVARLATADPEGRPYLVPVCYAFDGARFYTALDEKPKRVPVDALRAQYRGSFRGRIAG